VGGGEAAADTMRIVPNPQNNALLIYGHAAGAGHVEATLRRLDILPLQVGSTR
jgi:general secretion pathway protein D